MTFSFVSFSFHSIHPAQVADCILGKAVGSGPPELSLIVERYAFFLHALIDLKKVGGLAYRMLLYSNKPEKKEKTDELIADKIGERIEWSYTFSEEYSMFALYCESVVEAKDIADLVRNADGLSSLRMDIIENQITIQDWIDDEIKMKVSTS